MVGYSHGRFLFKQLNDKSWIAPQAYILPLILLNTVNVFFLYVWYAFAVELLMSNTGLGIWLETETK